MGDLKTENERRVLYLHSHYSQMRELSPNQVNTLVADEMNLDMSPEETKEWLDKLIVRREREEIAAGLDPAVRSYIDWKTDEIERSIIARLSAIFDKLKI